MISPIFFSIYYLNQMLLELKIGCHNKPIYRSHFPEFTVIFPPLLLVVSHQSAPLFEAVIHCITVYHQIICYCCCMPSESYGKNGETSIFRSFHRTASSTTGGWSHWNILMFIYIYIIIYHSEHYGLIFGH